MEISSIAWCFWRFGGWVKLLLGYGAMMSVVGTTYLHEQDTNRAHIVTAYSCNDLNFSLSPSMSFFSSHNQASDCL